MGAKRRGPFYRKAVFLDLSDTFPQSWYTVNQYDISVTNCIRLLAIHYEVLSAEKNEFRHMMFGGFYFWFLKYPVMFATLVNFVLRPSL